MTLGYLLGSHLMDQETIKIIPKVVQLWSAGPGFVAGLRFPTLYSSSLSCSLRVNIPHVERGVLGKKKASTTRRGRGSVLEQVCHIVWGKSSASGKGSR